MIPAEQRERFVRELTEQTVDDFFEARGLDTGCEYSYVLHHRESDDPQAPGMHNPHTHVVLPGTIWSEEFGERIPLYFSQNKKVNHIEMMHSVTEQNMENMLDMYIGPEWEQRIDALETLRQQQRQITDAAPHGHQVDEKGDRIPFWAGVRQFDEDQCAVGYYMPFQRDDGTSKIEFRPIANGLDMDYAERLSKAAERQLSQQPENQLDGYQKEVKRLLEDEEIVLERRSPSFDLDL